MCISATRCRSYFSRVGDGQSGVTLIELVVFIVIVSIAVAGVLSVLNVAVRNSADPQLQKQALAIAEALLEEVESQPFTFCDPDDASASTATSAVVGAGGCSTTTETSAQHTTDGESRTADPRFDNVIDYDGYVMTGVSNVLGSALGGGALSGYTSTVTIEPYAGLGPSSAGIASSEVLHIVVSVVGPGDAFVILEGYRSRYAPRT